MIIVEKKPHTDFKFLNVQSKKLSYLEAELGLSFIKEYLGSGIMLLSQTYNEYDEPNIMIGEIKVFGGCLLY